MIMTCDTHGKRFDRKPAKVIVTCEWCGQPFTKKRSAVARSRPNLCDRGCCQEFVNFCGHAAEKRRDVNGRFIDKG